MQARAFRRLAGKTQVFTSRASDHFRSRLTHTIEVMQIARSVAGALGLNEDLAETLALVHDIGHPPFGHAGERALDECLQTSRPSLRSQSSRPPHRRALRTPLRPAFRGSISHSACAKASSSTHATTANMTIPDSEALFPWSPPSS